MNKLKTTLACMLLQFSIGKSISQEYIPIKHYTKEYGVDFRWVYDITQDDDGFLWLANHTGLRRYDGQSYVHYAHIEGDSTSISTNTIKRVTKDNHGGIWAYGADEVLNRLDLNTNLCSRVDDFITDTGDVSSETPTLKHFASLQNGDFILLTQEEDLLPEDNFCSLWKFNAANNSFVHLSDVEVGNASINYFTESPDGKLWLWGMGDGYYLFDLASITTTHFPVKVDVEKYNHPSIPVDTDGNFWYPSSDTTKGITTNTLASFKLPETVNPLKVDRISIDNVGNIWFYHNHNEVYHYDIDELQLERLVHPMFAEGKSMQLMHHYYEDKDGNYWNGHFFGAVAFGQHQKLFSTYFDQPVIGQIAYADWFNAKEILELAQNRLLVRRDNFDLYLLNTETETSTKINLKSTSGLPFDSTGKLFSLVLDEQGYLWANQLNTLLKIDLETGIVTEFKGPKINDENQQFDPATSNFWPRLFFDAANELWWCDLNGTYLFDRERKKFEQLQLSNEVADTEVIYTFAAYDPDHDMIYATYNEGIYKLNCSDKSVALLKMFEKNEAYDLMIVDIDFWKNEFWLSTNKGLIRFNPETKHRESYRFRDGLPTNLVYSAVASDHELWLATKNGLYQFDPFENKSAIYFEEHGLPSNEFNIWSGLKSSTGALFFGGLNGVIGFHPESFRNKHKKVAKFNLIEITKFNPASGYEAKINLNELKKTQTITLNAEERNISIRYMLAIYDNNDLIQYSHFMEGIDKDWVATGNHNEAHYLNLPPGTYTFRARATGPNNTYSSNMLEMTVVARPYWYLSWWAFLAYFLVAAVVMVYTNQFLISRRTEKQEAARIRELDQFKTRMYTNITHEFRTPITTMLGMNSAAHDYAKAGEEDKVYEAQEMIDRNGRNLLRLVNQMLELSKLESGQIKLNFQQGNIIDYLKYRLESFQSSAAQKQVQIDVHYEEEEIIMDFDTDKMSYIIGNLMSNAIKFTPPKGLVSVHLSSGSDIAGKAVFTLKVVDTGIGIEPENLEHIFDRFYQVDGAINRRGEGTGIGLSLVKELVKLLDGTIQVESLVHAGSAFTVSLPITRTAELATLADSSYSDEWVARVNSQDLQNPDYLHQDPSIPLILVVEDNPDVAHYLSTCLKDQYRLQMARDGKEGIDKAIELIPDIIISDVMMPVKSGFELCESIKADERTSHIPIVLLTGKVDFESKLQGLQHGADAYLSKPFHKEELLIRLKNLLSLRAEIQKQYEEIGLLTETNQLPPVENKFLLKLKTIILENLEDENFDVVQLCQQVHMSRTQLHRKLVALTGKSVSHFIRKLQLDKAKELLTSGALNVGEVAYQVGFKTQAHFSRVFSETFGKSPSDFRKSSNT